MESDGFQRRETGLALEAVSRAASLCRQVQSEMVLPLFAEKKDRSPVTVADYGAQALVCQALTGAFPDVPIVAEETPEGLKTDQREMLDQVTRFTGQILPEATPDKVFDWISMGNALPAARFWTLDPIDGTKGFLRGEQYAIALALIENGTVQIGLLVCPNLPLNLDDPDSPRGVAFVAERDHGAATMALGNGAPKPISVDGMTDPARARFVESVEARHADHQSHQQLANALGITRPALQLDSQAKYGVVARGDASIYLRLPSPGTPDYRECIWDHAAGALVVEEAGGRVTDASGAELDFGQGRRLENNQGVIVSNAGLHTAILEAWRGIHTT